MIVLAFGTSKHRVGVRHVQAVLDNLGADQDVVGSFHEAQHDFFELLSFHLPVPYCDTCIGDEPLHQSGNLHDVLDAVVDKVDLAPARELVNDGIADEFFVEGPHFGSDWVSVGRRRLDDRQVAGSHQRELQGARNRGGCQGERVHIDFDFL